MATPKYLLKPQPNDVFRMITEVGLDPADFEWRIGWLGPFMRVDLLVHHASGALFKFSRFGQPVLYSPGSDEQRDVAKPQGWAQTVQYFGVWLNNVKRDAEPNLWEGIAAGPALPAAVLDAPRTRFTEAEQAEIHARLVAMIEQIAAFDGLTPGQKQLFGTELRNVDEAKNRMDRGEWFRFAAGSILAVLLASDVQHSVAALLLRWTVSAFQSMATGNPIPPLLLPP